MSVILVDPNKEYISSLPNAIPQYQDMYIFAELTAQGRGRTVLETNGKGIYSKNSNSLNSTEKINFLGVNNEGSFTTNYYDGSTGNNTQYEGFGIGNIKISINSSFIPQVNIQFIDVRGLAFFNQEKSPYRILFDFPPPIFQLTLKGYYGGSITYQLHMVKYTTEFKSDNGNFIIDAQFVAITYAPLADILFRYVVNFSLINNSQPVSTDTSIAPVNTFDLILKLRNLYNAMPEMIKSDVDNERYTIAQKSLNANLEQRSMIYGFKTNSFIQKASNPIIILREDIPNHDKVNNEVEIISSFGDYDEYLNKQSTDAVDANLTTHLYIGYESSSVNLSFTDETYKSNSSTIAAIESNLYQILKNYRTDLINKANQKKALTLSENDIPMPNTFTSIKNNVESKFVGLDLTKAYQILYKEKTALEKTKSDSINNLNETINNSILKNLGMKPTVYNIVKLIMDDVDTFFNKLRSTSIDAEDRHHKIYQPQIINDGNYKDLKNDKIYSFPLIISQQKVCNQIKQIKVAPIELSQKLPEKFPELTLIQDFIDSFIKFNKLSEQASLKTEQNEKGDYKWIPFTPVDSVLASQSQSSPYFGLDSSGGGDSSQPINISTDPRLAQVFKILLTRYYILTQNTFSKTFYTQDTKSNTAYVNLYSASEAINLANSITNPDYADLLMSAAKSYSINPTAFYNYLNDNLNSLYAFNSNELTSIDLDTATLYCDRKNSSYVGAKMTTRTITERVAPDENSKQPIDKFLNEVSNGWFKSFFIGDNPETIFKFTQENVILIDDDGEEKNVNISKTSKFISALPSLTEGNDLYIGKNNMSGLLNKYRTSKNTPYSRIDVVNGSISQGNIYFDNASIGTMSKQAKQLELAGNFINVWGFILGSYDKDLFNDVINPANHLSALVYLSNFGYTLSPYNRYPHRLNEYVFNAPAVITMPNFLPAYIGALVRATKEQAYYNEIKEFFTNGAGRYLGCSGALILADIQDINTYMSFNDKEMFLNKYYTFFNDEYPNLHNSVLAMYTTISGGTEKVTSYIDAISPDGTGTYSSIYTTLMQQKELINYNQITFNTTQGDNQYYESLKNINDTDTNKKGKNDIFFKQFFTRLNKELIDKRSKLTKQEEEFKKSTGDDDIINQTYYSLKNINDKWISGFDKTTYGYPFNEKGASSRLINSFVFVDRAMNPIGDTIVNPEILIQALEDPNVTVFSVISQLLSLNGFEFFPLQNFLDISDSDKWENSFKIDTGSIVKQKPAFVCMYVGGSSSYPTGIAQFGLFDDDSILDLSNPGVSDFGLAADSVEGCGQVPDDDNQTETYPDFPYRQVRAFRIKFGEQNQSMFKDIKIDSKEYPETNESIQILSQLAGDNKQQAPIPKGQNLYNLYENRSYKATITGLGNVMIQPTQYFQLENVPLYNGAYVILGVEHNIEPNKMTTSFYGTKIQRYPLPRVLNPATIVGFDTGTSPETNANSASFNEITMGVGTAGNPEQAKYNSMYTLLI